METQAAAPDAARVEELVFKAYGYLIGAVVSGTIYLGDRLGLYRALSESGRVTSEEFALRTGLNERWVREWLRGQVAAGFVDNEGEEYSLSPEAQLVLVDESTPASAIGAFEAFPETMALLHDLPEAFRTGIGISYDDGGPAKAASVERGFAPWNRSALIEHALPAVPGLVDRLKAGAKLGDIGCGAGVGTVAIASAFPNAEVHGYDNSRHALDRAGKNLTTAGVTNCAFHNNDEEPIPQDASFDAFIVIDALHDMPRPDLVMQEVRGALKPDGIWFIGDIDAAEDWHDNLKSPIAPLLYGASIFTCLASATSTPDGLGLGSAGLPESKLYAMLREAGFTRMARVPGLEHPFNAYYYAQP